eukprot:357767-Chlamydomonas_euryale.AAC.8
MLVEELEKCGLGWQEVAEAGMPPRPPSPPPLTELYPELRVGVFRIACDGCGGARDDSGGGSGGGGCGHEGTGGGDRRPTTAQVADAWARTAEHYTRQRGDD